MNEEDINNVRLNYAEVVQRWGNVKSSPSKSEVEVYRNDIGDSMVAVNSYEEFCEKRVSEAKDMLSEAKKMKRNLKEREAQSQRVYWMLKNQEPKS